MSKNITRIILSAIAVIFALVSGIATVAWLLPSMFRSLGDFLIKLTGNADIALNVSRISKDPIAYALSFAILALATKWLSGIF